MSTDTPDPQAAGDEAWKEHIRAENAELDRAAATGDVPPRGSQPGEIPPADFPTLVEMFATQALVALGMIPHPATGKADPQLPLAKHFIDLLGVVESKTTGNLSPDESSLLGGTLHYLRMSYIELSKRAVNPKN